MNRWHRSLLILLLPATCVGCDQVTKDLARHHLAWQPPVSWLHDTVRLEYAENAGAFLGAGSGLPDGVRVMFFQAIVGMFLAGLFVSLFFSGRLALASLTGWCLVLSGGVGNLLDRVLHGGRVIDFMNLGIGGLRTGIFNVADVCITAGMVVLLFETSRRGNRSATE